MPNCVYPERSSHVHEHLTVLEIGDLIGRNLRNVQGETKDLLIGLPQMHKARADEEIDKAGKFESAHSMRRELPALVADHTDLERVARLKRARQLDHLRKRARLGE